MQSRTTRKSPFEVVYGRTRHTLDLVPLPNIPGYSIAAEHLADHIHIVQRKVREQIEISNTKYKEHVDIHRQEKVFKEGDDVMVYLRKGRLPTGSRGISKTFHVADIYTFYPQKIQGISQLADSS